MQVTAPERTDHQLMVDIAAGNQQALEQLYHRHARWLLLRLQSRCADPETVDSALQDTFISVWTSAKNYRPTAEVGAWLWSIAVRRLIDLLRRRKAPIPTDPTAHLLMEPDPQPEPLPAPGSTAHQLLSQLPADLHAVAQCTYLDGLTTAETAVLLGIPQGTVKSRLSRARSILKEAVR